MNTSTTPPASNLPHTPATDPFDSLQRGVLPDPETTQSSARPGTGAADSVSIHKSFQHPSKEKTTGPINLAPIKHMAKLFVRLPESKLTHNQALEGIARALMFTDWHELGKVVSAQIHSTSDARINSIRFLDSPKHGWRVMTDISVFLELDHHLSEQLQMSLEVVRNILTEVIKDSSKRSWDEIILDSLSEYTEVVSGDPYMLDRVMADLLSRKVIGSASLAWCLCGNDREAEFQRLEYWSKSGESDADKAYLHLANYYQLQADQLIANESKDSKKVSTLLDLTVANLEQALALAERKEHSESSGRQACIWLGDIYSHGSFERADVLLAMDYYLRSSKMGGDYLVFYKNARGEGDICHDGGQWDDWRWFGEMIDHAPDEQTANQLVDKLGAFISTRPIRTDPGYRRSLKECEDWESFGDAIYDIKPENRTACMHQFHAMRACQQSLEALTEMAPRDCG